MQQGITSDRFKEDVKQQALDMAKQDLALDAWARHFELLATDADVAAEFEKSGAEDPKALQEEWRKNGQLHLLREGIMRSNAMRDVMDKAQVTEIDFAAKKDEGDKKPAKKAAAKKAAKKAEKPAEGEAEAEAKPAKKAAPKKKAAKKADAEPEPAAAAEDGAAQNA